jgi:hypothetical protein
MNAITSMTECSPTAAENETKFLLAALRGAILRAKLDINEFTSIGLALRNRMISPDGAIEWLEDSGLIGQVLKDGTA